MDRTKFLTHNLQNALLDIHRSIGTESDIYAHSDSCTVRVRGRVSGQSLAYASRLRRRIELTAEKIAAENGSSARVVFQHDDAIARASKAVGSQLELTYSVIVPGVSISVDSTSNAKVIVYAQGVRDLAIDRNLRQAVTAFLSLARVKVKEVEVISLDPPEDVPLPIVLRSIRVLQPASLEQISDYLRTKGFPVQAGKSLRNKIDRLRKSGQIIVELDEDGRVFTRLSGTKTKEMVGHTRRDAPDIERALWLARRKW